MFRLSPIALGSLVGIAAATMLATGAHAQPIEDETVEVPASIEYRDFVIDLGVGGRIQPTFEGSAKYEVLPYPLFALRFLRLPVLGEVVDGTERAFSVYPSINFVGARDSNDAGYLRGLDDVDFSFELGPGFAVRGGNFRGFAEIRYGITGHNGFVGEFGAEYIWQATDRLSITAGPRVGFASTEYMDAYFGVTPAESARSGLRAFNPDAGIKDVGLGSITEFVVNERVRLYAEGTYKRFVFSAADSPIIDRGAEDQFTFGIGFTYRFGADVF